MLAMPLRFIRSRVGKVFSMFVGTICALALSSTVAFAQTTRIEVPVTPTPSPNPLITNTGDLLAGTAGSVSNGFGELNCFMNSGNYWVEFQASTGFNTGITGTVECSVQFPSGDIYDLGMISVNQGVTPRQEFFYCPYGTYTFIYEVDTLEEIDVAGFIYD